MAEVPDIIKSRVRAFLLSCSDHKEPIHTFEANYGKLYKKLNLKELGFDSIRTFMAALPDAVQIRREGNNIMLVGIPTEQNKHIVNMIDKQKKPKKKSRDSAIFPRFQAGGGRVSYPSYPQTSNYRSYRPPPSPYSYAPTRSKPPPYYMRPPQAKQLSAPPASYKATPSISPTYRKPSPPQAKPSIHDRLGPMPTPTSSLANAVKRHLMAKETASQNKGTRTVTASTPLQPRIVPENIAYSRRVVSTAPEPLEIRIDGSSEQRIVCLKSPVSTEPPASVELVCEVDSDGVSDDDSFEFPVDSDFLRMLVFYVLSPADTERNWVSASGLGSRMRRRFAKASVETPPAIAESILKFMQYEWKDMFEFSENDRGDCCHLNTPFHFCPAFRDAYIADVETLAPQIPPSRNEPHPAWIVHVDTPAFYVRFVNDQSEEFLTCISEELAREYAANDSDETYFTYRKDEMCAVCVEVNGNEVWRRGRLELFTLLGSELDEQTSELTAYVKVFLVDTGEVITARAGDVRALPKHMFETQALAYRCVFMGARLEKSDEFKRMMDGYVNQKVELHVYGEQNTENLITLQVRIHASSYLMDDLANDKILSRVTCSDPEPAVWPPDTSVPVSLLNWHSSFRSVLVQLNHPDQLRKLEDLEEKLTEAVANEKSVTKFLVNNLYIWRRPDELSRRVRLVNKRSDGLWRVMCLDHGCICAVAPPTDLCLPASASTQLLMTGMHFFTANLKLGLIPPRAAENDFVRERLRQHIRGLCERDASFLARHDTLVSEAPVFMLYPTQQNSMASSLNCELLRIIMDVRNWEEQQVFRARQRRLEEVEPYIAIPSCRCLVLRLDAADCLPNFEAHGREFRYLQRCCLDFTAREGDSVMWRLSDLPKNTLLSRGTKLVYREPRKADSNASLMCRMELLEDFTAGALGAGQEVPVTPVDDPLLSMRMASAPQEQLFTVPLECFGARPLERFSDDLEPKELELFCELLQHLPAVDQLALYMTPGSLPAEGDVAVEFLFKAFTNVNGRLFPMIIRPE